MKIINKANLKGKFDTGDLSEHYIHNSRLVVHNSPERLTISVCFLLKFVHDLCSKLFHFYFGEYVFGSIADPVCVCVCV